MNYQPILPDFALVPNKNHRVREILHLNDHRYAQLGIRRLYLNYHFDVGKDDRIDFFNKHTIVHLYISTIMGCFYDSSLAIALARMKQKDATIYIHIPKYNRPLEHAIAANTLEATQHLIDACHWEFANPMNEATKLFPIIRENPNNTAVYVVDPETAKFDGEPFSEIRHEYAKVHRKFSDTKLRCIFRQAWFGGNVLLTAESVIWAPGDNGNSILLKSSMSDTLVL